MTSNYLFNNGFALQTFDSVFLLRADYSGTATNTGASNFKISTGNKDLEDHFFKNTETSIISGIANTTSSTIVTNFKKSSIDLGDVLMYKGDLLDTYEDILTNNPGASPTLYGWGNGSYAGNGGGVDRINPGVLSGMSNIKFKKISSWHNHSAAITTGGALYTWGTNGYGELGRSGSTTSPLQVGSATTWKEVACGKDHTLAIKTNGTLWSWGRNAGGQLGHGDTTTRGETQVGSATNWSTVSASTHSAAVKTDGTLWSWGPNSYGQLGLENFTQTNSPTQMKKLDGTYGNTWVQVDCGYLHTIARDVNGNIWSTGYNAQGQLGLGSYISSRYLLNPISGTGWKQVSAGLSFSAAVKADGTLWTWGSNSSGQLAIGSSNNTTNTPAQEYYGRKIWNRVECGAYNMAVISNDGFYYFAGYNTKQQLGANSASIQTTLVKGGTGTDPNYGSDSNASTSNWKRVAIGYGHVVAIIGNSTTVGTTGL